MKHVLLVTLLFATATAQAHDYGNFFDNEVCVDQCSDSMTNDEWDNNGDVFCVEKCYPEIVDFGYPDHVEHDYSDSLDPNDCSRGIDESNQEACDPS